MQLKWLLNEHFLTRKLELTHRTPTAERFPKPPQRRLRGALYDLRDYLTPLLRKFSDMKRNS